MSDLRPTLAIGLRSIADALDGGDSAQRAAVKANAGPTILGLTALVQLVGPIERILAGHDPAVLEDSAKLANLVLDGIAMMFPKTAPVIANIELAESFLLWLRGAYVSGAIQGGMPAGWHPGTGTLDPIGNAGKAWSQGVPTSGTNPSGATGG